MKKLFLTILILSSFCVKGFCAIPNYAVWDVRTTGDSSNGGCYDITGGVGTDYSQQNSAQLSLTDLAMTTGGTTLTSSTGGFTSAMVDNCIQISSGTNFTAGFYEITAYTDTNTVTLDRDATDGSNASSGSGKVGGALDHPQRVVDAIGNTNVIYIKSGTYSAVDSNDFVLAPTQANGLTRWIGYSSSHGDFPTGTDRPLLDATGVTNGIVSNYNGHQYYSLRIANADDDGTAVISAYPYTNAFYFMKSSNNGGDGFSFTGARDVIGFELESTGNSGGGFETFTYCFGCYSHDNTGSGFTKTSTIDCIADSNTPSSLGGGFVSYYTSELYIRSIAYNNTNSGFFFNASGINRFLGYGNISSLNGKGFNFYNGDSAVSFFNRNTAYGNTSGNYTGNYTAHAYETNYTTDPAFNDASNGDFTLTSSSGILGSGYPDENWASRVGLVDQDYSVNIGVDQSDHTSGGTGTVASGWTN